MVALRFSIEAPASYDPRTRCFDDSDLGDSAGQRAV